MFDLGRTVQEAGASDSDKANVWWKAKKWVLHITFRLFNRYAQPKHCKDGNDKQFAQMYAVSAVMPCLH